VPPLPSGCTHALAGAVREALLNVEKHARASSVLVSLFRAAEGVAVTVYDDGEGPPAAPTEGTGLGLAAATDRLGQVAGTLRVGRNDDGGVTVRAWVPC
jgi:signal transduction histidine kinase